jgi:GNAT superfamily N-acetyltransferase
MNGERRVRVRQPTISDLDLVAPLFDAYRQFYRKPTDIALAKQSLSERMQQGEAVGFTQLYPSFSSGACARIVILNDLFVVPEARRSGVGTTLLRTAAESGKAVGAARLTLSTEITNKTAQALYEAEGWKQQTDFFVYNFAPVT